MQPLVSLSCRGWGDPRGDQFRVNAQIYKKANVSLTHLYIERNFFALQELFLNYHNGSHISFLFNTSSLYKLFILYVRYIRILTYMTFIIYVFSIMCLGWVWVTYYIQSSKRPYFTLIFQGLEVRVGYRPYLREDHPESPRKGLIYNGMVINGLRQVFRGLR